MVREPWATRIGFIMAAVGIGVAVFLLGILVTMDLLFLDLLDGFAFQVLLLLGDAWLWAVRIPISIVLLVSLYLGLTDYVEFLTTDLVEWLDR